MKKTFIYICILAAFAAVSCNRTERPEFPEGKGDLNFVMLTSDLVTRATEPGDDTYNENTIETIDWFFFSDEAGENIIKEGRLGTTGTALSNPTLSFNTSDAEYAALKKTFYAYFLVNYPGSVPHDNTMTWEDILDLPITATNFEASPMPVFVMDSYEKAEGLLKMKPAAKNEKRTETVSLTRVAAKMVLNINVSKSVAGNGDEVWTPEIYTKEGAPQLQAYFVNALKTTTVAAAPAVRDGKFVASSNAFTDADKYFSYSTSHAWVNNGDSVSGTADSLSTKPFYTYPQAFLRAANGEPYFKIFLPWTSSKKGTNNFYYKVLVPGLDTLKRNCFYHVNLNLDVIGGTTDDYVLATSDYLVAEWFSPGEIDQTGISSARFLDVAQDTIKFYNQDTMAVAVTSSHAIIASITSATKYDFYNKRSVTLSTSDYSVVSYGKNLFSIKHNLDRVISNTTFDCSPITFKVTVKHTDNKQQKVETVTVIQYPPIYIEQETSNGVCFANSYENDDSYSVSAYSNYYSSGWSQTRDFIGSFGSRRARGADTGENTNPRQYTIYVSVLPSDFDAVIGDPRGNATHTSSGITHLGNDVETKYRPSATNSQSILAPAFKFASSYGATDDLYYERAEQRCAAYQENGYPAGRWRVPTVAEIEFACQLSEYNHIPQLFNVFLSQNTVYGYWAGGKYSYGGTQYEARVGHLAESLVGIDGSGTDYPIIYSKRVNNTNFSFRNAVRCVYDVWYWGDDPDSAHLTTWGGYQTD